eukprot:1374475-Amorphochlora_amoeboformis.AAC.2
MAALLEDGAGPNMRQKHAVFQIPDALGRPEGPSPHGGERVGFGRVSGGFGGILEGFNGRVMQGGLSPPKDSEKSNAQNLTSTSEDVIYRLFVGIQPPAFGTQREASGVGKLRILGRRECVLYIA